MIRKRRKEIHTFLCSWTMKIVVNACIEPNDLAPAVRKFDARVPAREVFNGLEDSCRDLLEDRVVDELSEVTESALK